MKRNLLTIVFSLLVTAVLAQDFSWVGVRGQPIINTVPLASIYGNETATVKLYYSSGGSVYPTKMQPAVVQAGVSLTVTISAVQSAALQNETFVEVVTNGIRRYTGKLTIGETMPPGGGSGSTSTVTWNQILQKPTSFPSTIADVVGLSTALGLKINSTEVYSKSQSDSRFKASNYVPSFAELTGKPNFFSGNYFDLLNKPTIPTSASQVGAWTKTEADARYVDLSSAQTVTGKNIVATSLVSSYVGVHNGGQFVASSGNGGSGGGSAATIIAATGTNANGGYTHIQGLYAGVAYTAPIVMQDQGGSVRIGSTTEVGSGYKLQVSGPGIFTGDLVIGAGAAQTARNDPTNFNLGNDYAPTTTEGLKAYLYRGSSYAEAYGFGIAPSTLIHRAGSNAIHLFQSGLTDIAYVTANGFGFRNTTAGNRNAMTPSTGFMINQTDSWPGTYRYNGSVWERYLMSTEAGNVSIPGSLTVGGNVIQSSVLPGSLSTAYTQQHLGQSAVILASLSSNDLILANNAYPISGGGFKYKNDGPASLFFQSASGSLYIFTAPSGIKDANATFTSRFSIDLAGNITAKPFASPGISPTTSASVGMGTSPSSIITNATTYGGGEIYFTTGTTPSVGKIMTYTFNVTLNQTPHISLAAYSDAAATDFSRYRVKNITTTGFEIWAVTALQQNTEYAFTFTMTQ
ncbi:hypothetical protein [Spirosoma endbachense]|uniref:Uncharacterized protein n=1 Tax=Spirosoma endbachense TaxID=2666025 RepID=A0A6P1VUC3_9BACT|nr:hypothetical protein [Spirosoma endbachense]QHV96305.1 hypothetical protein GJR95_15330 [Spirosoma endbachense]